MEENKEIPILNIELGVGKTNTFNEIYPEINEYLTGDNLKWNDSRDGEVKEILDFKTMIGNPYRRCVGGYKRNINVFFLLAEAMWIAVGRKDVAWLSLFNKQMIKYSDDQKCFHAPYGYRIRHWGNRSENEYIVEDSLVARGYDQLSDAVRLFSENPNTRQVVLSIWNPSLDLGYKTRDIPCNDIVMLKIRDGRLITTIGNRSNDLHLGLPTNVFQFSFLTEIIASVLGIKLGTQTHNSQSLHVYKWNNSAFVMAEQYKKSVWNVDPLYDAYGAEARPMDFAFVSSLAVNRLVEVDTALKTIIGTLSVHPQAENKAEEDMLHEFSLYLYYAYQLLKSYLCYRSAIAEEHDETKRDDIRRGAIARIEALEADYDREWAKQCGIPVESVRPWDISALAKNFMFARLSVPVDETSIMGNL